MATIDWENSWIWHPDWNEKPTSTSAGRFVYFRKSLELPSVPKHPVTIRITADTKYKLYINSRLVHTGPVKGDQQAWFYDVLDIQPHLRTGRNTILIHVLRFYHGSLFATSFPRGPYPGLYIRHQPYETSQKEEAVSLQTDDTWETAIDPCRVLPTAEKNADFFLHTFEQVDQRKYHQIQWVAARPYRFMSSYGLTLPWNLHPRMIPFHRTNPIRLTTVHNIESCHSRHDWELLLDCDRPLKPGIILPKGTQHHVEFGVNHHMTGFVKFRFGRPSAPGSILKVTWAECYEDEPIKPPFVRQKGDRADSTKSLYGPSDNYVFGGTVANEALLGLDEEELDDETFAPFHFRTFRYFALDIIVADSSDLVLKEIEIVTTNYPLHVSATFYQVATDIADCRWFHDLWKVSLRTLENCMHDCYEDCPFYEQLQYAMDTRSSALFTYQVSRDDCLAKQAIAQLYNSFQPAIGLTASRAPAHHLQIISHFSLFWVCMITDHYEHFGDGNFIAQFLPVVDAILNNFHSRLDKSLGLVSVSDETRDWAFVDWSDSYQPFGIPPAGKATGFLTYTNQLYAYTLQRLGLVESCLCMTARADEHNCRANFIVQAIRTHCFDGEYFTDGLASLAESNHYSEHGQIWAVLCGSITGKDATDLLNRSLGSSRVGQNTKPSRNLTKVSTAMAFYSLRALASAGDQTYEAHFYKFWEPWRKQLDDNMTTWVEDFISMRSDCHAWGSLPLYEFTAEVAGLRPVMTDGKRQLIFKPRTILFKTFDAEVPVGGIADTPIIACVKWQAVTEGVIEVSLSWKGEDAIKSPSDALPVHVKLPDGQLDVVGMFEEKQWRVNRVSAA
ncbi:Six-hairpin glycosidase-like protein [Penicillium sp. IBT 31633x]|nr:Six-hairpin glycosidase-like protein [Penicillium sp. IBT 31633x]